MAAAAFRRWDAMAPASLSGIRKRGPFRRSAETGCGGSTIVFSHASERHVAFAIEGEYRTITELRTNPNLNAERVTFIEGETRHTVPKYDVADELDIVLLDGPHAYPFPQIEFAYLFPLVRVGGWLVLDDIQIPSVHELFQFLRRNQEVVFEEVVVRTAFFRRVKVVDQGPDGWELQGMNRRPVLRYAWRDRLRKLLGRA